MEDLRVEGLLADFVVKMGVPVIRQNSPVGRELDVLIATEVMGLVFRRYGFDVAVAFAEEPGIRFSCPYYSTTYEGMGLVLERMRELGWEWSLDEASVASDDSGWEAVLTYGYNGISSERMGVGYAATLPHAVCLAALKAVRTEEGAS